jgi:hypothetical protein
VLAQLARRTLRKKIALLEIIPRIGRIMKSRPPLAHHWPLPVTAPAADLA